MTSYSGEARGSHPNVTRGIVCAPRVPNANCDSHMEEIEPWDAVVIGGGFYGANLALELRKRLPRVRLVEREKGLLRRASYANQARVHNGYHYPRSILTAIRSRHNYGRFCNEFPGAIVDTFTQTYAVARRLSKVNAQQFERFCRRIGAEISPAPKEVTALFSSDLIEAVFVVKEAAFDASAIASQLTESLAHQGVTVTLGVEASEIEPGTPNVVRVRDVDSGKAATISARQVFTCTYSATNQLLSDSGVPCIALRHELAELALVEVPDRLKGLGITVMDGPFFSVMPFPVAGGHSFSHVRYTPHRTWTEDSDHSPNANHVSPGDESSSSFSHMLRDAMRYVPSLADTRYVRSLWEVKTVLPKSERDDSRPAFIRRAGTANIWSVVGAKIDGVYDVLESMEGQLDMARSPAAIG